MEFNFTLENSTLEDSLVFDHVNGIMEEVNIIIRGVKLTRSKLFTDLNVSQFCTSVKNQSMSSAEYTSMQSVLKKHADKKAFVDALVQHLVSFSEGVAASVLASCILK